MVRVRESLVGKVFGKLTVLQQADDYVKPNGTRYAQWICLCSCEDQNKVIVRGDVLKRGDAMSCGCIRKDQDYKPHLKHRKYNKYDLESEEYGIGYTLKDKPFWFDKEDYYKIKNHCWHYDKNGYLVARERNVSGNELVYLHRLIMEPIPEDMVIDHKRHPVRTGLKMDNRKSNLEIVTQANNTKNQGKRTDNTSGVTGVYWDKRYEKWQVKITADKKEIHIGYFEQKDIAIQARKNAELKYFGDHRYSAYNF